MMRSNRQAKKSQLLGNALLHDQLDLDRCSLNQAVVRPRMLLIAGPELGKCDERQPTPWSTTILLATGNKE